MALLLTFAAGCVDVIGYLTLYNVFTAHMTGDTVHLGQSVMEAHWMDAAMAGCVIAAFLGGSIVGRTLIEIGSRTRARHIASVNLLVEAALIVLVVPIARSERHVLPLLPLLAAAMGMQTATLTRVGSLTVHTTFVTGMLNKLAQLLSNAAFVTYDLARGRPVKERRDQVIRRAQFMGFIWVFYLLGAMTGTWLKWLWGIRALLPAAGAVVIALIADQVAPLAIEEEREDLQS